MNLRKKLRLFITSFLVFLANTSFSQTDVYLKIYTKTFQRMELDLYPFTTDASGADAEVMASLISGVLQNDLWMSGYFKVNLKYGPSNGQVENDGKALAIINGSFQFEGSTVKIRPVVVDRASGGAIIRSTYEEPPGRERRAIHRIADDIVYNLSGEQGIANSKIAYVHELPTGAKEIAVMDYDGYNVALLTSDKTINLSPEWSPDGHKLCYTSYKEENPNLYFSNLKTGTRLKLSATKGLNSAPAWSPDGRRIALTLTKDGNAEIYTVNLDTRKFERLTYSQAIESSPSWSPSNREIAFTSDRTGSPQVYIMDSDGVNVRRLTFQGSYNDSPAWSPRGDKIAFVSRTDSGFDIYTIDATGENLMRLTDSSSSNEDPVWSPNGFALMFSSNRSGKRDLYSMFWDGTDQKKVTSIGTNYLPAWSSQ